MLRTKFLGSTEPTIEGHVHPAFSRVADALRRQIASYGGGAAACVYHRGECVVDVWGGAMDTDGEPWRRETMAPSFSTTKGVASTLVHILADRGLVRYDDRVAEYWPEFAQAGKDGITIRQVMAHQSGLYHIRQMIDDASRMRDWRHMIRAIERATPVHPPGKRTGYHGLTYGFLVGEIAQRVTGESFSSLVQSEIAGPLGLDGLYVGAPAQALKRAASLMWSDLPWLRYLEPAEKGASRLAPMFARAASRLTPLARIVGIELDLESLLDALAPRGISVFDFGSSETLRAAIPSGNGLFTARSLARMYALLADGGELEGVRLLSKEAVACATELQARVAGRSVLPFDMRWRLGYHGVYTSRGVPRNAFGHFGFGGSGAWAEPKRRLAVALIVNSGMGTPLGDLRIVRIGGEALAAADAYSPRQARPTPKRRTRKVASIKAASIVRRSRAKAATGS